MSEERTMEIQSAASFLAYFESVRARTKRVAARIPEDRVEWAPRAGAFTLGDQLRHIAATERWMFAENAAGRPSRYPGCGVELAEGKDGVLAYLDAMHAESAEIIGALSDEDLRRTVRTPAGTPIAAWKWLRAMVEHEAHHRGQVYLLLNLLEVPTPPIYGLTSEEVYDRSVHE
ncbi:MAG TPA: DinB family protein [Longimicrobium sp.]|nr:DinB family protein [Longimicrobium sp.]